MSNGYVLFDYVYQLTSTKTNVFLFDVCMTLGYLRRIGIVFANMTCRHSFIHSSSSSSSSSFLFPFLFRCRVGVCLLHYNSNYVSEWYDRVCHIRSLPPIRLMVSNRHLLSDEDNDDERIVKINANSIDFSSIRHLHCLVVLVPLTSMQIRKRPHPNIAWSLSEMHTLIIHTFVPSIQPDICTKDIAS